MKKKWMLCMALIACAATVLSGCKKNVGTPEDNAVIEEDEDEGKDKTEESGRLFGFCGVDMSNPFYETLKSSIQTELEEQGDRIMVKDPAGDAILQATQIQELIDAGASAVFVCPADWEEITPALEALNEADIPVINLDTEAKETKLVDAFVGSDNKNAGSVCGQDLVTKKPDGGKIAIIENPTMNSINERITGFEEAIAGSGFEVVKRIRTGNDVSGIRDEVKTLLKENPKLDAIMCGSDPMAEQVMAAIEAEERSDVLVYSVDGSPVIKKAILDGKNGMTGAGAQSPITLGKTAVKVADAILSGDDYDKKTHEETFFINRDNVEMYGTDGWQ